MQSLTQLLRCRTGRHPDDQVAYGTPNDGDWIVATCHSCWRRWVTHDHRISDDFLDGMRTHGVDPELIEILERSNSSFEAKRVRDRDHLAVRRPETS